MRRVAWRPKSPGSRILCCLDDGPKNSSSKRRRNVTEESNFNRIVIMKTKLKYLLVAVAMLSLTGCVKVWEEDCQECRDLPETELPVEPSPWEPGGEQES